MASRLSPRSAVTPTNREAIADEQRKRRRSNRHSDTSADWNDVDAVALHHAVVVLTGCDCAIQFGRTKDGSSFVIRIVGDGEPYNEFVRPSEDINAYLTSLAMDFEK